MRRQQQHRQCELAQRQAPIRLPLLLPLSFLSCCRRSFHCGYERSCNVGTIVSLSSCQCIAKSMFIALSLIVQLHHVPIVHSFTTVSSRTTTKRAINAANLQLSPIYETKHYMKSVVELFPSPLSIRTDCGLRRGNVRINYRQISIPTTTKIFGILPSRKDQGDNGKNDSRNIDPSLSTDTNIGNDNGDENNDIEIVYDTSKTLKRLSFISWWSQVILTTISSVILLFARSILSSVTSNRNTNISSKFFLSGIGLVVSFVSILWTWGNGTRLSYRLIHPTKSVSSTKASVMIRKAITIGVILNLTGLLINLLAAEQIVGTLAVKVLAMNPYTSGASIGMAGMNAFDNTLQPLDILVVQANTNSLLSHFVSLCCSLYLTKCVETLDNTINRRNYRNAKSDTE